MTGDEAMELLTGKVRNAIQEVEASMGPIGPPERDPETDSLQESASALTVPAHQIAGRARSGSPTGSNVSVCLYPGVASVMSVL